MANPVVDNFKGILMHSHDAGDITGGSSGGQITFQLPAVAGSKCRVRVNKAITITSAIITGDIQGSAVIDIWKDSTYPPTVAKTITASAKPTLANQTIVTDSTLTGWTKDFSDGDWLVANVDSASTLNDIQVILTY